MSEAIAIQDSGLHGKKLAFVLGGLALGMFVSSLSETIASTALPTIVGDLGGVEIMQWVTTAYILTSTITMPLYGKLGDIKGRKGLLMFGLGLYAVGKVVCGISINMAMLICGRCISGMGGGGLIILSQAALADVVPPRKMGTYMGAMGALFSVSNVLGPLLGGWFVQVTGWRWIFWFTVPLALLAIVMLAIFLPRFKGTEQHFSLDIGGTVALTLFTASLTLVVAWGGTTYPWDSLVIVILFAVLLCSLIGFVVSEKHARTPIFPLGLFKNRNFVLCSAVCFLINIGFMGCMNYLPTYFQIVDKMAPEIAGLMCVPMSIGVFLTSLVSGWLVAKTGKYKIFLVAMCIVSSLGFYLMSTLEVVEPLWRPLIYLFILGFGLGLGTQIMVLIVQNEFPHTLVGTATAANNYFRQIGSTVGAALVGAMFAARLTADLANKLPHADNLTLSSLTPSVVDKLPDSVQTLIAQGYSEALIPLFLWFIPLCLVSLVLVSFVKQHPLAKSINHEGASAKVQSGSSDHARD